MSSQTYCFSSSYIWMWELDYKEDWALENWCFWTLVSEKTLESPLDCQEMNPVNPKGNQSCNIPWKDWCWSWSSNTLPTWCVEPSHYKRPYWWERLKAGREGDNTRQDGWMVSPTQWTWVWASFGSWWWTGKPGVLQSIRSQRVRDNWATEQQNHDIAYVFWEGNGNSLQYYAWRISWAEELGGLQCMGSQKVRHAWSNLEHT